MTAQKVKGLTSLQKKNNKTKNMMTNVTKCSMQYMAKWFIWWTDGPVLNYSCQSYSIRNGIQPQSSYVLKNSSHFICGCWHSGASLFHLVDNKIQIHRCDYCCINDKPCEGGTSLCSVFVLSRFCTITSSSLSTHCHHYSQKSIIICTPPVTLLDTTHLCPVLACCFYTFLNVVLNNS